MGREKNRLEELEGATGNVIFAVDVFPFGLISHHTATAGVQWSHAFVVKDERKV